MEGRWGSAPHRHVQEFSADEVTEVALQRDLRLGADDGLDDLAALVDIQCRDGHHAVLSGGGRVLVDIQLDDVDLLAMLGSDRLERWGDLTAWAAPCSPEIDENGLIV